MQSNVYKLSIIFGFTILLLSSCADQEPIEVIECDEDALFERVEATGTMFYLSCYEAWSIQMDELNNEGNHLYAASLSIPEAFHHDGMNVKFAACFYIFDLPLLFPDPSFFGETYVVRNLEISEDN